MIRPLGFGTAPVSVASLECGITHLLVSVIATLPFIHHSQLNQCANTKGQHSQAKVSASITHLEK